jgi:hypothetical protein
MFHLPSELQSFGVVGLAVRYMFLFGWHIGFGRGITQHPSCVLRLHTGNSHCQRRLAFLQPFLQRNSDHPSP